MKRSLLAALACWSAVLADSDLAMGQPAVATEELVRRLGSDVYSERDAATRDLLRREDAWTALERALRSSDQEVRARARQILAEFDRRKHERLVNAVCIFAAAHEADRIVDILTRRLDEAGDARCWEAILDLAASLLDSESREYGCVRLPKGTERSLWSKMDLRVALAKGKVVAAQRITSELLGKNPPAPLLLRGHELDFFGKELQGGILVCAGQVRAKSLYATILLANGDVTVGSTLGNSIVICDGDFTANQVLDSMVIARNAVNVGTVSGSTIVCGGRAEIKYHMHKGSVVGAEVVHRPEHIRNSILKEDARAALSFVRFFQLSETGAEVEMTSGMLRVKTVHAGKRFARAGLRDGDVVLSIGGTMADSPESSRRLVRERLAVAEDIVLRVRRGDQIIEIAVSSKF